MKSASYIAENVRSGKLSALDAVNESLKKIEELDPTIHAFITVLSEYAIARAKEIDEQVKNGRDPGPLAGVPIAIKDNICTPFARTTCGSKILESFVPPYSATVIDRLEKAGAVIVGKTNMDEFAMGSSTEHSAFFPTYNPVDTNYVPGGSSGGSAAAVASQMVPVALGSDTGGSIRQPAALCGVVGLKPTYGMVSRYGLVAFASSLDQIGPIAGNIKDALLVYRVIAGHDPLDSTSLPKVAPAFELLDSDNLSDLRIGVIGELKDSCEPEVLDALNKTCEHFKRAGANVDEVSLPNISHSLAAYYIIAPAEASSNLARYDGVRYGARMPGETAKEMMINTRTRGFGAEVKRRIMLGTYALSAGYYDAYYGKAQKVRTLIISDFQKAYDKFDVLISPTSPTVAFKISERTEDPMKMYFSDLCTIASNLAGHPAMSIPFKMNGTLPIGIQIMASTLAEPLIFRVANYLEGAYDI
jgi:aspartyl-tRNA(Asn)/glutamyl-tRNA(Gln) amidotransferase subunit A